MSDFVTSRRPTLAAAFAASSLVIGSTAGGAVISDTFDRSNSNNLGVADSGQNWVENETGSNDFRILNGFLQVNSSSSDQSNVYINEDFDSAPNTIATFTLSSSTGSSGDWGVNGAFLVLPRAEGSDIVGNVGWYIARQSATGSPGLARVFAYDGSARDGNGSISGTAITTGVDPFALWTITVDGNLATLNIGGADIDVDRNLGTPAGNGTADHFMLAYNQTGNSGRNFQQNIDNFSIVIPEPSSLALASIGALLVLAREPRLRRRC